MIHVKQHKRIVHATTIQMRLFNGVIKATRCIVFSLEETALHCTRQLPIPNVSSIGDAEKLNVYINVWHETNINV